MDFGIRMGFMDDDAKCDGDSDWWRDTCGELLEWVDGDPFLGRHCCGYW